MEAELLTPIVNDVSAYFDVSIIFICFLVGFIINNYTRIDNNNIPLFMIIAGIAVSIITAMNAKTIITTDTFIKGGFSGLASSGSYDLLYKSLGIHIKRKEDKPKDEDKTPKT